MTFLLKTLASLLRPCVAEGFHLKVGVLAGRVTGELRTFGKQGSFTGDGERGAAQ